MKIELVRWPQRALRGEPTLLLRHETWDDFGRKSLYRVWFAEQNDICELGHTKIIGHDRVEERLGELELSNGLSGDFVSFGQSRDYYEVLEKLPQREEILSALRDVRGDFI